MSAQFERDQTVLLDRSLKVRFIRALPDGDAIVEFAGGTRVVPQIALSAEEA